ncbi:hypothetical protein EDB19DRAFT_1916288 [Suillus lakei]|nr:hypothetical protein EDB19DRAFT_1916288 [Suillus lakei]
MTPALPQLDDVFGGPRERTSSMSGDAASGLMQNQHNQMGTGHAGQTSSPEFSHPYGLPHETPSHSMRAPSVPNFTPSSQGRSPYLGHDSRTPFSNSEPSSRAQSLGPARMEYNQHPYPRQQQQMSMHGFSRPPLFQEPGGYHSDDLQNQFSQLAAEHARLSKEMHNLYERSQITSEKLTTLETFSLDLQAAIAQLQRQQEPEKKPNRTLVNKYPELKSLIHPLFFEFCCINQALKRADRIKLLCEVEPLETGEPFELCEQKQVWHPNWKGHVDDEINAVFIQEIAMRLWNNEKALRERAGMGQIPDGAYAIGTISDCVKSYFRNVHKQYLELNDDEKAEKALRRKTNSKHRARRQTVTKARRKAAKAFESQASQGAMAMIDTDFASDVLSYASDGDLSDNTIQRRKDAGVGDSAFMVEGSEWRSVDYVVFLRWLTFKSKNESEEGDEVNDRPPSKRRKVTQKKKQSKLVFDLAPSKMNEDPPISHKKTNPTVPFKSMVSAKWLKTHLDMVLLDGGEWLSGFYGTVSEKDVYKQDWTYLKELDGWQKMADDAGSESDVE